MINWFLNFYINIQVAGQIVMVNITNLITHCEGYMNSGEQRLNTRLGRRDAHVWLAGVAQAMFVLSPRWIKRNSASRLFVYTVCFHFIWSPSITSQYHSKHHTMLICRTGFHHTLWYAYTEIGVLCCSARPEVCVLSATLPCSFFFRLSSPTSNS